jgi:hypothetical protein
MLHRMMVMSKSKTGVKSERRDRSKRGRKARAEVAAHARSLPAREWDRGTELVKLFASTGAIKNSRPQSLLLVSEPGTGKTELLERFRVNRQLSFHSDLTVRQLWPLLKDAKRGQLTHIVATEFQKMFQRKASVAENLLGTLVQAMEEGVSAVGVGPSLVDYEGARIGLIGAMTNGTLIKKREFLSEMGFLSRAACLPWDLPVDEERDILSRISNMNYSDIDPVKLELPDRPETVGFEPILSRQLEKYVIETGVTRPLRVFNRLRSLTQGAVLLDGGDKVQKRHIDWVLAFAPYWKRLVND